MNSLIFIVDLRLSGRMTYGVTFHPKCASSVEISYYSEKKCYHFKLKIIVGEKSWKTDIPLHVSIAAEKPTIL